MIKAYILRALYLLVRGYWRQERALNHYDTQGRLLMLCTTYHGWTTRTWWDGRDRY